MKIIPPAVFLLAAVLTRFSVTPARAGVSAFRTFRGLPTTVPVSFYQGTVYDANGNVVTQVSFGTATTGRSFYDESLKTATFTSISMAAQNGTFSPVRTITAGTHHIGSTDALPEPSGAALTGIATLLRRGVARI